LRKILFVRGPVCPGCGGPLDGVLDVCPKCLRESKRPWKSAVSVFSMNGFGRSLVHKLKYRGSTQLARPLGLLAAASLIRSGVRADVIVPTPLHWMRQALRGYNQSALLCLVLSAETGPPVKNILRRVKWTKQQARLGREKRKMNLSGAFSAKTETFAERRAILVADDVMTTGSTLEAAVNAVRNANPGAGEINVLVLARR
jgi:ComF family protein